MKIGNVLSLFDGMSCGQIALERAGIEFDNYYASEIDKYGIEVTQANYPRTIQLGDVTTWKDWNIDWNSIDLILAGSPCQGFSFAGKLLAFDDERSKLFFVFIDILNHIRKFNSNVDFLLENVRMKQEHQDVISQYLKVKPIIINSNLVSAQNRLRLYWTSIPNLGQPENKGILLRDILEREVDEKYYISGSRLKWLQSTSGKKSIDKGFTPMNPEKASCLTARGEPSWNCNYIDPYNQKYIKGVKSTTLRTNHSNGNMWVEMYQYPHGTNLGGKRAENGKVPSMTSSSWENNNLLVITKDTGEKVLRVKEATKSGFVDIEEGECVDLTFPTSKTRRGHAMKEKSNCLTSTPQDLLKVDKIKESARFTKNYLQYDVSGKGYNSQQDSAFYPEGKHGCLLSTRANHKVVIDKNELLIRKLTPIECERLQTVPDNYTQVVCDSQRYKMLGNGWTVDVIVHILKNLGEKNRFGVEQDLFSTVAIRGKV
jgi:DNA-cytosine methyltransferase